MKRLHDIYRDADERKRDWREVERAIGDAELREFIRQQFRSVFDLPRIVARLAQRRVTPRDLVSIRKTLEILPDLKARLANCSASLLNVYAGQIFPLEELADELRRALGDETPLNFRDGGFIESGYDARLDEYRQLQSGGKQRLAEFQASEIKKTGITTLKVGYNSVFGYYIEVTHAQSDKVPANYIRKQTLKNAERYITEELKAYEEKVLGAAQGLFTFFKKPPQSGQRRAIHRRAFPSFFRFFGGIPLATLRF